MISETELIELGLYWQRQLRLQDWAVEFRVQPLNHFKPNTTGCCHTTLSLKQAVICVLDLTQHHAPAEIDTEQTLVHELNHLHFDPFMKTEEHAEYLHQEQAIDLLAWALVRLNRGEKR